MKKIIVVLLISTLFFTGCGTSSLKKSSELVDSPSKEYAFIDDISSSGGIQEDFDTNLDMYTRKNIKILLDKYSETMAERVDAINASGGASGDVLTIGNATIGLIDNLVEYINENLFNNLDAEYVYNKLIEIRDNMIRIGFLN